MLAGGVIPQLKLESQSALESKANIFKANKTMGQSATFAHSYRKDIKIM